MCVVPPSLHQSLFYKGLGYFSGFSQRCHTQLSQLRDLMNATYLVKKPASSSYFFRASIPLDLRESVKTQEFLISLKTGLLSEAKKISFRLHAYLDELLDQIRLGQKMSLEKLKESLKAYKERLLAELSTMKQNSTTALPQATMQEVDELLKSKGLTLKPESMGYKALCLAFTELSKTTEDPTQVLTELVPAAQKSATTGEPVDVKANKEKIITRGELASKGSTKKAEPKTSEVIEEFLTEMNSTGTWREKTYSEYQAKLALFMRITGDIPISKHDFSTGREYKKNLLKLPANLNKDPKFKGKSISQVLKIESLKKMSPITINNHFKCLIAFFQWAVRNGYVAQNFVVGLKVKIKVQPQDQRQLFTDSELAKIFDPKVFNEATEGSDYRYWIPLIALYSGMRQNEIAQLYLDDLKQMDGVWVFDVNDETDDKQLKNQSSKRLVPLHPKLSEMGLINYHNSLLKKRETRLFPEIPQGRDGYGRYVSRWFNKKYLPALGIKTQGKCFHSFRHTTADKLKQLGIPYSYTTELLGHTDRSETHGRYGKRFAPKTLLDEAVCKLDFKLK